MLKTSTLMLGVLAAASPMVLAAATTGALLWKEVDGRLRKMASAPSRTLAIPGPSEKSRAAVSMVFPLTDRSLGLRLTATGVWPAWASAVTCAAPVFDVRWGY